jgi:hypothetical protein
VVLGGVWDGSRFQLQCGAAVYNINLNSFKNIFNLNNKQNNLSKGLGPVINKQNNLSKGLGTVINKQNNLI